MMLPITIVSCGMNTGPGIKPAWHLLWDDADGVHYGLHVIPLRDIPFTLENICRILWEWVEDCD